MRLKLTKSLDILIVQLLLAGSSFAFYNFLGLHVITPIERAYPFQEQILNFKRDSFPSKISDTGSCMCIFALNHSLYVICKKFVFLKLLQRVRVILIYFLTLVRCFMVVLHSSMEVFLLKVKSGVNS